MKLKVRAWMLMLLMCWASQSSAQPRASPLPQGARGLIDGRGEQDAPTLPINMGFGISFLGLLRRNSSASSIFANAAPAQYDIAANATLTNDSYVAWR